MNKRMLVLNIDFSGINEYLFTHLQQKGWELKLVSVPYPKICRFLSLLSTFRPDLRQWREHFNKKLGKLYKSPWVFLKRTKFCQKEINKLYQDFDCIFQISGMFSPYLDLEKLNKPYVTYNDYTMALAQKYPDWISPRFELSKWMQLEKALYENASLIFATNENARKSFINDYGIEKERVINVGCGLNLTHLPNFTKTYDSRTILFIGMDFERKGGFVLLDAFREVRKKIANVRLIIAGPNKNLLKIKEPGVEMLGYIQDKEAVKNLYRQASIFVMPSLCEPFGLVFLEAMAYKLPCIGTNIDAIPEIIEDGKTGFLVPPKDSAALAERMIFLLENKELMKEMGENGYLRVLERFNWDNVSARIDSHLRQVFKKREEYEGINSLRWKRNEASTLNIYEEE